MSVVFTSQRTGSKDSLYDSWIPSKQEATKDGESLSRKDILDFAEKDKPLFFTSAKDGTGIEAMFVEVGRMLLDKWRDNIQNVTKNKPQKLTVSLEDELRRMD